MISVGRVDPPSLQLAHSTSGPTGAGGNFSVVDTGSPSIAAGVGGSGEGGSLGVGQMAGSESRRPKRLLDTLRDAETPAVPRASFRDSIPSDRFCSYVALVPGMVGSVPRPFGTLVTDDEQVADLPLTSLPRGKHVHFRDKVGIRDDTFLGKREC